MKKVLLVDDKREIRLLVQMTLKGSDYEFYGAADGKEAVEKALSVKPDLILLDVMMPEMDGFKACRHIKSSPETESIPVIMLTAKGEEMDIEKGRECGADDYFIKPFSPLELLKKIDKILE